MNMRMEKCMGVCMAVRRNMHLKISLGVCRTMCLHMDVDTRRNKYKDRSQLCNDPKVCENWKQKVCWTGMRHERQHVHRNVRRRVERTFF